MLATKHVPPRRASALRAITLAGDDLQIVGATPASSCMRNYVVYLVLLGIVALAGSFEAGYHLAAVTSRDVARSRTRTEVDPSHQFGDERQIQRLRRIDKVRSDHERQNSGYPDLQKIPNLRSQRLAATEQCNAHKANADGDYGDEGVLVGHARAAAMLLRLSSYEAVEACGNA